MSIGFAQLISGVMLIISLMMIAIELKKTESGDQVNQMMMLVHAGAFIIYNVVIIVQYSYSLRYYLTIDTKTLN